MKSFRLAIEAAPTGMLMVDRTGRIVLVNAQIERLFGYPREALVGQAVEMLLPERFRGAHAVTRRDFFDAPSTRPMGAGRDLYGLRADGTEIRIEIALNPLTTPEGEFVLSSVADITERMRTEKERELRIRARTLGDQVAIEVEDTGSGMTPETLARIFEPFFTTRGQGSGTGLGLAICHGIVTAVGGAISVTSEVGKGTAFRVLLPAASVPRQAETRPSLPPYARGRILVVDDEELVLRAIRRVLSREHDVVCCSRARDALALIEKGERFDLIFSDLVMPEMGGPEFFRELERRIPGEMASVVFMSGGAQGALSTFLEGIPNRCLDKPFDIGKLQALVQELLAEARSR